MFSVFLSLTTISYIIIKKMGNKWGTLIATLLVSLLASDFYLVVQFTQCASLLSATGMLVFANTVSRPMSSPTLCHTSSPTRSGIWQFTPYIYALFLLLWGSIMRWEAFLMGMPFFCVGLLFLIKQCWAKKIHVIITLSVMFIAAFGLQRWDRSLYNTPEYKPYIEIQGPRAALGDGENYNKNAVFEDLEEMGKSGKDYHTLTNWIFYDTETFAKDSLRVIVNTINKYTNPNEPFSIPKELLSALSKSIQSPLCWFWILACVILFSTNRRFFPYTWASIVTILLLITKLLFLNRLVYRVENGFWLYAAILTIPLWNQIKRQLSHKFVISILAIIAITNIVSYAKTGKIVRVSGPGESRTLAIDDTTNYKQVFEFIDNVPNRMFLLNMSSYMVFSHHRMPPYKAEPFGSYLNTISFGFWTPYLPEITQALTKFGITNPIRQVLDSNVIVINEPKLGDFLQRHYYPKDSIVVDTLHTVGEIHFYKYRLVQNERNE